MIHYRQNCTCQSCHPLTNICTECAWHNHYDLVQHYKNGTDSTDPVEQKLLTRIRTEPHCRLRIGTKRHTMCGHAGIWQGSTCAVCAEIKRAAKQKRDEPESQQQLNVLKSAVAELDKNITDLQQQRETLQNLVKLAEMGFPLGDVSSVVKQPSPRQRAIQEGKKWYMPYDPCMKCGVMAERYVANGRCRNCGQ
ncbi:hypothetical protein [Phage vB_KsaM-C1]|nr:hypothetical protein [Phage vB_KsaM-C1]